MDDENSPNEKKSKFVIDWLIGVDDYIEDDKSTRRGKISFYLLQVFVVHELSIY